MEIQYETERLVMTLVDERSAEKVFSFIQRNRDFLKEWEPVRKEDYYTLEFQKNQIEKDFSEMLEGRCLRFWISKKEDEQSFIGCVAFSNIVWGAFLSCHVGYKIDKDAQNKGYMTEALRKGIEIIFNHYKLHRIEANIMPRNHASLRVVEKLGFTQEGIARQYLHIDGKWEDHVHMVLLND